MGRSVPSDSTFASHGLHNVHLDIPRIPTSELNHAASTTLLDSSLSEWICGSAQLVPVERYPLLNSARSIPPFVRFSFCPAFDLSSTARFRRQCQILALGTIPNAPGPSSRFGRVKEVMAWWEDGHGLWFIVEEDVDQGINLVEEWSKIMFDEAMDDLVDDKEGLPTNTEHRAQMSPRTAETVYGEICQIFVDVVQCLKALHERHLSLISCRPNIFNLAQLAEKPTIVINRLDTVAPLSSFNLSATLRDTPLASSSLFHREQSDLTHSSLDEHTLRKHLRYLSPETTISKRVSDTGDIYSFGVLAYEMLTGTTIDGGPDSPEENNIDVLIDFHRHVTMKFVPPREWLEREAALGRIRVALPPKELSDIVIRCLSKEPEERYSSLEALLYDLTKVGRICQNHGQLSKFKVGEVDEMARFALPSRLIRRDSQLESLEHALRGVINHARNNKTGYASRIVNLSGADGSGKTRIMRQFVQDVEGNPSFGHVCTASAKVEEAIHSPLSSFTQIFTALLDRFLTDPNEDVKEWNEKIKDALGNRFQLFVSLIPTDYWRMLGVMHESKNAADVDWSTLRGTFTAWARQLLQIFATPEHPLIIVVDDIQWMPQDEAEYWRLLLTGSQAINHVLVITTCRVGNGDQPPTDKYLSPATVDISVPPLSDESVHELIKASFHDKIAAGDELASFLHAETGGSSLFVRTLLATLVKDKVIHFDFETLIWRFDAVLLQKHLSKAGVDQYLERLILSLPAPAQQLLFYLACLPSKGFSLDQLQQIVQIPKEQLEDLINICSTKVSLLNRRNGMINFGQSGPKNVAYRLIPSDQAGQIHHKISVFLRQPQFGADYIYDAADHAAQARELGFRDDKDDEAYISLMLKAAARTANATSFAQAMRFLSAAEDVFRDTGGPAQWMEREPRLYTRYLQLFSEISCVLKAFDASAAKCKEISPYLKTDSDCLLVDTLNVRRMVAAEQLFDAVEQVFKILKDYGYEPSGAMGVGSVPQTPEDVARLGQVLQDGPIDRNDRRVLLMTLMGSAGSSVFYTEPVKRQWLFALGLSLSVEVGKIHETTMFFLITHALGLSDVPMKRALVNLAKERLPGCDMSYLYGDVLNGVAVQQHFWRPWDQLEDDYKAAMEVNILSSNFEQATNAIAIYAGTKLFAGDPIPLETTVKQYNVIRPFIRPHARYMIELHFQFAEKIGKMSAGPAPWLLDGNIVSRNEMDSMEQLVLHTAMRYVLALRLAVFYDAPPDVLKQIVESGRRFAPGAAGLIYSVEWIFMVAVVAIRNAGLQDDIDCAIKEFESNEHSPDFEQRLRFLRILIQLEKGVRETLNSAEELIDAFIDRRQHALSGLLSFFVGQSLLQRTGSKRLATGFLRAAADSYKQAHLVGLCEMLHHKWPTVCPSPPAPTLLPSQVIVIQKEANGPPHLRRASLSNSSDTARSLLSSNNSQHEVKKSNPDQLDAIALMRSSLALASEQDPPVLLCTLLRILCQFLRAEYAAIALCEDSDESHVRLRAAGAFSRILAYDIRLTEESARQVCPVSVILHTARTGKAITSMSSFSRFRSDPFFTGRPPRSIICIPISLQGRQNGVVMLSSTTIAATQSQWESAREVVSTLATFATIITSNVSFTRRLKLEVDQRTKELTNALAAKTQFLSQCSHELRSPLSAVLGLAAVLEASSGLSDVQREHLRTIISSGEDLLGLINNILDHSRLESGSVTLETIPFSCRDVVEGALDSVAAVAQKKDLELCLLNAINEDPPGLIGDPFRIKQILLNLLSNAVKFTHSGRVTVKWRWEALPENKVKVEMDVEDTGIGIPAQKMDKLFRSFSQIDESITRSFGGSGLGLIISKDLAKLLGGDCTATSEYGSGSKFTFNFVTDRDPAYTQRLRKFQKPHSCFIICQTGPWWDMLKANLSVLNCEPVRFADDVQSCLVKDHPDGLNSKKHFDFVMLNTQMINGDILKRMKELQPTAKMLYLVRSIDLAKTIRDYDITREAIISRPIKFASVMRAMIPLESNGPTSPQGGEKIEKGRSRKPNRRLAKECPLRILLVDDNAVNVTVGKRILELFGYKSIASANDGQQAIEAAEEKQYDLILLDLQMPVLDGFTAQKRINESPLAGDPCIVALTANADTSTQQSCEEAGFYGYLSKPLDIPKLERILEEVYEYRKERHLIMMDPPEEEK